MTPEQRAARRELARRELARRAAVKGTAEPAPAAAPAQAATPEQMEELGLGGLAETLGGFQQMEDPREGRGALTQGAAALGAGASRVARGALLETGLASAEALLGREEVEQSPSFALHKEWKAMEEGLYKPSVSFDDVLDDPSLANITSFIAESGVESVPAMATALWSMPRLALSMVGGIAQQRADNRGPGSEVTGTDLVVAAATSGIVAGGERLGGKLTMGGGPGATPLRRIGQGFGGELLTEAAQEGVQTIGEQAFTREGEGFVAGVDPTEMAKRMGAGALVGGPWGGVISTGVEGGRAIRRATLPPSRRREAPPTVIVEPEATPTEAVVEEVVEEGRRVATAFSGTGTVEAALTGARSVHAVEHDPAIVEQYNKAHGTSYKPRSIVDVDPAEIAAESPEVYHASPVCKNFSKAKRLRTADRSDVESAEAVSRVIREVEPPVVTVENVPAYQDTALFKLITDALDAKGYTWDVVEHDAADYGAPQSRKRMLLRAVREGSLPPLPQKTEPGDWYSAVHDLIADAPDSTLPPWERKRIAMMVERGTLDTAKPILTMGGSAGSGVAAAVNAGSPSKTLKATPKEVPRILLPDGTVKRVTPRMMARLMGLPDTFPLPEGHGLAKTVLGHGVSGEVTRSLIQPLIDRPTPTEAVVEEIATPIEEGVGIESVLDEEGEVDEDTANALDKIARDRGLGITRDRDPAMVVRDAGGDVIGGTYTSFDGDNYTFDVVVSEGAEGKGIASRLLDDAVQGFYEYRDMVPDATMRLDVINPVMRRALERRGFQVSEVVDNEGRVIMEPADYDSIGSAVGEAIAVRLFEATPTEAVVEGVVEETGVPKDTVPGEFDQIAPPPLPMEAGPEVGAVDIAMEARSMSDDIEAVKKEIKAEGTRVPRRPGAKTAKAARPPDADRALLDAIRATVDPGVSDVDILKAVTVALGARQRAEVGPMADIMAARNVDTEALIREIGDSIGMTEGDFRSMLDHEKQSFADTITSRDAAGLRSRTTGDGVVDVPVATLDLIGKLNEGDYIPTAIETAAVHSALMNYKRAYKDNLLAVEDAATGAEIRDLDRRRRKLEKEALAAATALRRGGTLLGRAMRYRQFKVNDDMTLIEAQADATLKKGAPLSEKEIERLNKIWKDADRMEVDAAKARKAAVKRLDAAQRQLKRAEAIAEGATDVRRGVPKKKRPKKKTVRQEAAEATIAEGVDAPIRVTPLRMSAAEKAARKAFRKAQKDVEAAKSDVVRADQRARGAKEKKATASDDAVSSRFMSFYRKVFGTTLIIKSSMDNSALGRQAAGLALQSPVEAAKTLPVALKAAPFREGGRGYARETQEAILSEPYQAIRDWAGLEMTEVEGLSNIDGGPMESREEMFMTTAIETGFFGGGKFDAALAVAGDKVLYPSQNVFALTLNLLRAKNFDAGVRLVAKVHGVKDPSNTKEVMEKVPKKDIEALALIINTSTGRGDWKMGRGAVPTLLNAVMFAPRYTLSRVEMPYRVAQLYLGTGPFKGVSKKARQIYMGRVGINLSFMLGLAGLSMLAAASDEEDSAEAALDAFDRFFNPDTPDFLKLVVGDWHVDLMGGIPTTMRYILPFIFTPTKAIREEEGFGKVTEMYEISDRIGDKYGRMFRNKLAPLTGMISDVVQGEDYSGRSYEERYDNVSEYLFMRYVARPLSLALPIPVENVIEETWSQMTEEEKTAAQRIGPMFGNFFGVGVTHYEDEGRGRGGARLVGGWSR